MNPLAWLAGLFLPACGFAGAEGLPPPPLMDANAIVRPATVNSALAGPESLKPIPDIFVPPFHMAVGGLFKMIRDVAAEQPRTYEAAIYPDRYQADYVARGAVFNFPDQIMVQVVADPDGTSELILWSRSVYEEPGLGANRRRLLAWLADLQSKILNPNEK
jgi:hypothetical protein